MVVTWDESLRVAPYWVLVVQDEQGPVVGACCWRFGACCGRSCWRWWIWDTVWLANCWLSSAFCCCSAEIWAWVWAWDCAFWSSWVSPPQNCPAMPWWGGTALAAEFHIEFHIWSGPFGEAPIQVRDCQGNGNMAGSKGVRYKIFPTVQTERCVQQPVQRIMIRLKKPRLSSHNSWRVQPSTWCTIKPYQRP